MLQMIHQRYNKKKKKKIVLSVSTVLQKQTFKYYSRSDEGNALESGESEGSPPTSANHTKPDTTLTLVFVEHHKPGCPSILLSLAQSRRYML